MARDSKLAKSNVSAEDRPAQLRGAAHGLFVKSGFDGTSMDAIARAAGVSKRTPYIYFENKHDLFSAVVLEYLTDLETQFDDVWQSDSGLNAIEGAIRVYAAYALEDPHRFELIMTFERRDFYPGRKQEMPANAAACQATNDRITARLVSAIDRAMANGELSIKITAQQFCLLLWSSLTGVLTIALERQSILHETYQWQADEFIDAFTAQFLIPNSQKV